MEVLEAIKARRSIRKYKTDPVPEKMLETVLEAARLAPSWANTQCSRFIVVRDGAVKNKIAETLSANNPATDAIRNAPVTLVACAELAKSGCSGGVPSTDKGDWFMFDVALAMQNLVLAAQSLGLATVYVGLFNAGEVARILQVPEGFCAVALTPLGFPDQVRDPRPRKELSEIVFYDRWDGR